MPVPRPNISHEDREALYDHIARYAYGLDSGDADLIATLFTPDGILHSSMGDRTGHEDIRDWFNSFMGWPDFQGRQHHVRNYVINEMPGGYEVFSYWLCTMNIAGEGARPFLSGYYRSHLVKHEGRWLFQDFSILPWNSENAPMAEGFAALRTSSS
jgi:hypothetical protein